MLFVLFPNINFFPFLNSNNQPVAFIIVIVAWLLGLSYKIRINGYTIFLLAVIALTAFHAVFSLSLMGVFPTRTYPYPGFYNFPINAFSTALTFISYLVGPIIFIYMLYNIKKISLWVILFFILVQLGFGVLQYFGFDAIRESMQSLFSGILIGFSSGKFEFGRGIAGTFPEPSHLGRYLLVITGLLLCHWHQNRNHRKLILAGFIGVLCLMALNQSLTVVAIFALWAGLQLVLSLLSRRFLHVSWALVICLLFLLVLFLVPETSRIYIIFEKFQLLKFIIDDFELIDLQIFGGIRFINMTIGYLSAFHFPLGQGIGSYLYTLPQTANLVGVDIWSTNYYQEHVAVVGISNILTKPNGYGAQLAYDFGIPGILLLLCLAYAVIAAAVKNIKYQLMFWGLPLVGLMLIAFYTTTTFPAPWILLALIGYYPENSLGHVYRITLGLKQKEKRPPT